MDPAMSENIYQVLDSLGIGYRIVEHPAAFTVEQADGIYGHLKGMHSKNLFLRNKKGRQHYLVCVESHKEVDLKALRVLVGESSLSFASPERLLDCLGLTPGSVSPFGLINDSEHKVLVILDEDLLRAETVNFHPNINTATVSLSSRDFQRFLDHCGHEVRVASFGESREP